MDMKINKETLRRERELRAWTQSHLADVADLSMRTVQRIERTGDASMESVSALAAALELELPMLMEMPATASEAAPANSPRYRLWSVIAVIGSTLAAVGWWSNAAAEQIMVGLSIETPGKIYSDMMLLNEVGQESEVNLENQFRMVFSTSRQGEQLLVAVKIYDNEYRLFSNPVIVVEDKKPASMHVSFPDGQRVNLQLVADF